MFEGKKESAPSDRLDSEPNREIKVPLSNPARTFRELTRLCHFPSTYPRSTLREIKVSLSQKRWPANSETRN